MTAVLEEQRKIRIEESFGRQKLMRTIGARLVRIAGGEVDVEMPFSGELTQQSGALHAGIVTALLDTACGYAAYTSMPDDCDVVSVEFKVNLLAPAIGDRLVARAITRRSGRTLSVCSADLFAVRGGEETLVATMLGTMMAVKRRE
ncbi:MAG TPA: PaaI family thioesterase [Thermoanaerobaculia bacterium]|nr:PaaI family thioesterase [Thermoanaerobaculia bacterium]